MEFLSSHLSDSFSRTSWTSGTWQALSLRLLVVLAANCPPSPVEQLFHVRDFEVANPWARFLINLLKCCYHIQRVHFLEMVWVTCSHLYKLRHASFSTNSLKTPMVSFPGLIEPLRSWYSIIFGGPKERELMQKLNIESIPRNFNQTLHEKFHQLLHSTKKGWKQVKPWWTHFRYVRCKDRNGQNPSESARSGR